MNHPLRTTPRRRPRAAALALLVAGGLALAGALPAHAAASAPGADDATTTVDVGSLSSEPAGAELVSDSARWRNVTFQTHWTGGVHAVESVRFTGAVDGGRACLDFPAGPHGDRWVSFTLRLPVDGKVDVLSYDKRRCEYGTSFVGTGATLSLRTSDRWTVYAFRSPKPYR